MQPITVLLILVAVAMVAMTIRTAYVTKHETLRNEMLQRHKTKRGKAAYDLYVKVYSREYVVALAIFTLWPVLYATALVISTILGRGTVLSLVITVASIAASIVGGSLMRRILKE